MFELWTKKSLQFKAFVQSGSGKVEKKIFITFLSWGQKKQYESVRSIAFWGWGQNKTLQFKAFVQLGRGKVEKALRFIALLSWGQKQKL